MVNYVNYFVHKSNVMRDQNETVLIVLQELGEPFDVFFVKIVGWFIEQHN
ncbi:hypothetical protein SDC9_97588 [bioreactor metagenome]|uniref:Uncharacterized protein n=1 Tax=bioreactor metagenome TaxID=1076179 RepID=A0A645ACB6_9ZZZZ